MVYGRGLKGFEQYGDEYTFLVGATYKQGDITQSTLFHTITQPGRYRFHMYGKGGYGGQGTGSYGGGGGSRGNIGIHDIELAVGNTIRWHSTGLALLCEFYDTPQNVSSPFLSFRVGEGRYGGAASATGTGDGGGAPITNTSNFNVLSFNAEAGKRGTIGVGGNASVFEGDLSLARYTNHEQNGGIPSGSPLIAPWLLGLGGHGGPLEPQGVNQGWLVVYGGVVLEKAD